MSEPDIDLRFVYDGNADMRNFRVYQVIENAPERLEFHHPTAGHVTPTTTYKRKNLAVLQWETAGRIEWPTTTSGTVWFGVDEVPIKDLRRIKNGTSQGPSRSRRFKFSGNEYKWKVAGNGQDLFCVDSKDKHVAIWTAQDMSLKIAPRCVTILERIVITCFLNLWFKGLNRCNIVSNLMMVRTYK
ncbi:hypothetical protein EDD16DRAFT_1515605 [Pisolithus croceorrhizus]|nr:hypothetical protein EDD16DRAFT_1515605 [Pisolithus croceorrhizus]